LSATAIAQSAAADFLNELNTDGTQVTWKQRQVTGTDAYGQPMTKWNNSTITAIVGQLRATDLRLVEPGYSLDHYCFAHYSPSVPIALLDQIVYAGVDYEVRIAYPRTIAGVPIFGYALLRAILVHQTPP
jgi:hypothetical protein